LRDCQAGGWDPVTHEPSIVPLAEPFTQALAGIRAEQLLVNRLTGPLIAATAAARSDSCVADAARDLLDVILAADRRGTIRQADHGYGDPRDQHGPAVAAVLAQAAVAGDTQPLTGHIRAFTATAALDRLLHDLALVFTYDDQLRPAVTRVWREIMTAALDEISTQTDTRRHGRAVGKLIPGPQVRVSDTNPVATIERARQQWPSPNDFADLIARLIPLARGQTDAIDALTRLAQCGTPDWQATTGLVWATELIADDYATAGESFLLTEWLSDLHRTGQLHGHGMARWRRLVDGLAAQGDDRAVRLQQVDERG
jgi:hypothetical protein